MIELNEQVVIPTYIINLKKREERLLSVLKEFDGRDEFDLHIIEACENQNGNVGLWESIVKVVKLAQTNGDEVILLVEDDHVFTNSYSRDNLFSNVIDANCDGVDILLGGIGGGFQHVIPVTENRFWINHFWCTQFVIIYEKFFDKILNVDFNIEDGADNVLSELTLNKMVIYPFISVQKSFGYSDIQDQDKKNYNIETFFNQADKELSFYYQKYKQLIKKI